MSHPLLSAPRAEPPAAPIEGVRPVAWAARTDVGSEVAILITEGYGVAEAVRGYRTLLPGARVFLYGHDLSPDAIASAHAAGASARVVPLSTRQALIRRMFADIDADIVILAHGAGPEDVCLASLIVAEIEGGGKDLVDVSRFGGDPMPDMGDRLLSRTVDFLFGHGGDTLASDFKACSRRFAFSYRSAAAASPSGRTAAMDLALHALQLRLPVGRVMTPSASPALVSSPPARTLAGWIALLGLVIRLLVDERPRRIFGLFGLAALAVGVVVALPALDIHHWQAALPLGPTTLVSLGLGAVGAAAGVAGLMLDTLAAARQEVRRIGCLAIPRRN